MAQIIVRNLDEGVKTRLRARARRHKRSMEEEVREILRNSVKGEGTPPTVLGTRLAARFSGAGIDFDIPEQRGVVPKPAVFNE